MNKTLTKRSYKTQDEMSQDFWRIHYASENNTIRPDERLWRRQFDDGPDSDASRLWNNQWYMLNGGRCWIPCHGPTCRRLFPEDPATQPKHYEEPTE